MDTFKVHFPQIGTVRGKPVLPHHAEQIDFMSLHTTDCPFNISNGRAASFS